MLAQLFDTALDVLFPPRCPSCKCAVGEARTLCTECWKQMRFITAPLCNHCGHPFEFAMGEGALCAACIADEPPYHKARAVLRYDDKSRRHVAGFKFYDATQLAPMLATWMARVAREFATDADLIVPVPLHRRRLLMRRYNQSAMLAYGLGRELNVTVLPDGLMRLKYTPPQAGLTRAQRLNNVQGAFRVNPKMQPRIKGAKVILVDDVITTGATIHACTKALLKAGAGEVYVLTLAKTVVGG